MIALGHFGFWIFASEERPCWWWWNFCLLVTAVSVSVCLSALKMSQKEMCCVLSVFYLTGKLLLFACLSLRIKVFETT